MNDSELNRRVAEARGWTSIREDRDGLLVGVQPDGGGEFWVPDVCQDGAARSELFDWLVAEKRCPSLWWEDVDMIGAAVGVEQNYDSAIQVDAFDPKPGRALALAFLKAVQP